MRLAFTECLGPCSDANVVLVYVHGRPLWFRRVNTPQILTAVLDYCRAAVENESPPPLPDELGARTFSWTGGGIGPVPPVETPASE